MRLNRLDLNLLVVLDTILTERSVTRASEQLRLTQAATSNALRRLRETFNDPLLVSSGREMVPTPFALGIASEVADIVRQAHRLSSVRPTFDPATSDRRIVVMLSDYAASIIMSHVVRRVAEEAPNMIIEMVPMSDNLAGSLERGEADLIIVPASALGDTYPSVFLFEDEFVCVAWSGNDAIGDTLTMEAFAEAHHVVFRPRITAQAQGALRAFDIDHKVAVYAPNYGLVPRLVHGTNRLAMIHRRSAERLAEQYELRLLALPFSTPPIREHLFWHTFRGEDAARQWMRGMMVAAAEENFA